jgi:hypothetical protein
MQALLALLAAQWLGIQVQVHTTGCLLKSFTATSASACFDRHPPGGALGAAAHRSVLDPCLAIAALLLPQLHLRHT